MSAATPTPAGVEGWLAELGLAPPDRLERALALELVGDEDLQRIEPLVRLDRVADEVVARIAWLVRLAQAHQDVARMPVRMPVAVGP